MASARKIQNEEQYFKSLTWLVQTAEKIEDPLLDEQTKTKLKRQYDFVEDGILRYQRGQRLLKYPHLRQVYQDLGWAFDDPFEDHQTEKQTQPEPEPPQPAPKQQKTSTIKYDWLDDDD